MNWCSIFFSNTRHNSLDMSVNMANAIRSFQSVQTFFKAIGIFPTQPHQKYSFNLVSFFILISLIVTFMSSAAFFLWGTESVDKTQSEAFKQASFYISSTNFGYVVCFLVNIWKMDVIIKNINDIDRIIEKSEFVNFLPFEWRKNQLK